MGIDLLPDSRPREARGAVRGPNGETLIPIYCANCGTEWGRVPSRLITFAFALCDPCAEKYGPIAHTYAEPDSVFWERVQNAQLEKHGTFLPLAELARELADPKSTMSKLAEEWRRHVRQTER